MQITSFTDYSLNKAFISAILPWVTFIGYIACIVDLSVKKIFNRIQKLGRTLSVLQICNLCVTNSFGKKDLWSLFSSLSTRLTLLSSVTTLECRYSLHCVQKSDNKGSHSCRMQCSLEKALEILKCAKWWKHVYLRK